VPSAAIRHATSSRRACSNACSAVGSPRSSTTPANSTHPGQITPTFVVLGSTTDREIWLMAGDDRDRVADRVCSCSAIAAGVWSRSDEREQHDTHAN
jgi:hypothetical protein